MNNANQILASAAYAAAESDYGPLEKLPAGHYREVIYRTSSGVTLRQRTSVDHRLAVTRLGKERTEELSLPERLEKIFGETSHILYATWEVKNRPGRIWVFSFPTEVILKHIHTCIEEGISESSFDVEDPVWAGYRIAVVDSVGTEAAEPARIAKPEARSSEIKARLKRSIPAAIAALATVLEDLEAAS